VASDEQEGDFGMTTGLQKSAQEQLRNFVESIERLQEEAKGISADIRDKMAEAKAVGFDVKILREVLKLRKKSETEREEAESILEVYLAALDMLPVQRDLLDPVPYESPQLVS